MFDASLAVPLRGVLITAGVALVTAIIPHAVQWARDREASIARTRRLDEATKRVAFWDSAHRVLTSIGPDSLKAEYAERTRREIDDACQEIATIYFEYWLKRHRDTTEDFVEQTKVLQAFETYRSGLPWWRRWLLFYLPQSNSIWGWAMRVLYYLTVCATTVHVTLVSRECWSLALRGRSPSFDQVGFFSVTLWGLVLFSTMFYKLSREEDTPS
jgi:hypothetical protein